jgi:hypothetical protein
MANKIILSEGWWWFKDKLKFGASGLHMIRAINESTLYMELDWYEKQMVGSFISEEHVTNPKYINHLGDQSTYADDYQ